MAIKVRLRQKKISGNKQSLYLDFYPAIPLEKPVKNNKGELVTETRREFLGLYLFDKPKNPIDKTHNKDTLQVAEQIRQKRENHLNKPEIYSGYEKEQLKLKEKGQKNFIEYFQNLAEIRKASNHDNWVSTFYYLNTFTKGDNDNGTIGNLKFADLNEDFCNNFKKYLQKTYSNKSNKVKLSQNTALTYFNKFKASLKQAYKDEYLKTDLNEKIKCIEPREIIKQTLTYEELNKLAKAECQYPNIKKIVLFSAFTGLPFKEMQNLKWEQIDISKHFGVRIKIVRQKTGKGYHINISDQAYNLLGKPQKPTDKVFEGITNNDRYKYFPLWLAENGIKKKMTFHDLRHTYGTMQIDFGTDIYTLQGNMGHATPRQSMHYGKISDKRKREAVEKIKFDIENNEM